MTSRHADSLAKGFSSPKSLDTKVSCECQDLCNLIGPRDNAITIFGQIVFKRICGAVISFVSFSDFFFKLCEFKKKTPLGASQHERRGARPRPRLTLIFPLF